MSARRAKQLIYGVFYGIIWVFVFYGFYSVFLRPITSAPAPMPCGDFCPPTGVKPIQLQGSVYSFPAGDGRYTFLAKIANVNTDYASDNFTYTFTAYDASNTVLAAFTDESFIYGSELKYLLAPNETVPGAVDHAGLTMTNTHWVSGEALGLVPQFAFRNMQAGSTSSTVSVGGEVENKDINAYTHVFVIGIWTDRDGNPLGASETKIDGLSAGSLADFSVLYPALPGIDPGENQVFAYALRGD